MKTLYFLLFGASLLSAQSPELLNTHWEVTKIVSETFPDQFPPVTPQQQVTNFSTNPSEINISFFNNVVANITYGDNNTFKVNSTTCTNENYNGDNGEVNLFANKICNFFKSSMPYYYSITNNGNEKTMMIGDVIFQAIYLKAITLGTKDNKRSEVIVYPNPTTDVINIENLKSNSSLELFDNSGKLVKSISNKTSKTEINIKNLPSGIYYLKADGKSLQKIIKK